MGFKQDTLRYAVALGVTLLGAETSYAVNPNHNSSKSVLEILGQSQIVQRQGLSDELNLATTRLRNTSTGSPRDLNTRTIGKESLQSVGIGTIGETIREPNGLPSIYSRNRSPAQPVRLLKLASRRRVERLLNQATPAIARCYGPGMNDGETAADALEVMIELNATGSVTAFRVLKATTLGARDTEACAQRVVTQLRFPAGLTDERASVFYRWRIRRHRDVKLAW